VVEYVAATVVTCTPLTEFSDWTAEAEGVEAVEEAGAV
jgi:hypothetical protein